MALEDGFRRGVGPCLLVLVGMAVGVGAFRSTHSLGARLNATFGYPLHHSQSSPIPLSRFWSARTRDSHPTVLRYRAKCVQYYEEAAFGQKVDG